MRRVCMAFLIVVFFLWTAPYVARYKQMLFIREVETEKLPPAQTTDRIRAAFVMLLRPDNRSLALGIRALASLEKSFNHKHHYPLVIFHEDEEMEANYGRYVVEQSSFSGKITFERVHFSVPAFLDESRIPEEISAYNREFSIGYRHMCRFYAGQIFELPVLKKYDYIWRIDDDAMYICDMPYDPFRVLMENNKVYGYAVEWYEADATLLEGLWEASQQFAEHHRIPPSQFDGYRNVVGRYTKCHFWNNFEILDMRFFKANYLSYFKFIDQFGGIYYHRWGDALIRTLGVLMYAQPDEIYHFTDIGYMHANSCVNPCGWKPEPGQNLQCNDLITARDPFCNIPRRFVTAIPFAVKQRVITLIVVVAIITAIYAKRQGVQYFLDRHGLFKRTRRKRELE